MQPQFKPESPSGKILHDWWKSLEDNKGDRAALRRCHRTAEVLFVPAYHDFCRELCSYLGERGSFRIDRLPAVAGLIAHAKLDADQDLPRQMAHSKVAGGGPILSELRFRRLLQCQSQEELFLALLRVIRLLEGKVNIYSLADSVYWWGDKVRRDWAYAYYGAPQNPS